MFRLHDDLQLVVSEEKRILPLCQYLRHLATAKGISTVDIENHALSAMMSEACVVVPAYISVLYVIG